MFQGLLTVKEAAQKIGVSKTTIYDWMQRGVLNYQEVDTHKRLIDKDDLVKADIEMQSAPRGGHNRRGF